MENGGFLLTKIILFLGRSFIISVSCHIAKNQFSIQYGAFPAFVIMCEHLLGRNVVKILNYFLIKRPATKVKSLSYNFISIRVRIIIYFFMIKSSTCSDMSVLKEW